jgi:general secretion pathway protein L
MNLFQTTGATLNAWTGSAAAAIVAGLDRVVSPRVVRLIEADDGGFAVEATGKADNIPARIAFNDGALSAPNLAPLLRGSRVEIVLQPKRFLLRPLELPARADRPADAVERQRGGVRLQSACRQRHRKHHHYDCGHHAQGGDGLC